MVEKLNLSLENIEEQDPIILANLADPESSLLDSKYARPQRQMYNKIPSRYNMPTPMRGQETGSFNRLDSEPPRLQVQQEILDRKAAREAKLAGTPASSATTAAFETPRSTKSTSSTNSVFEDQVVAKFKARAEAKEKNKENTAITNKNTEAFPSFEDYASKLETKASPSPSFEDYTSKLETKASPLTPIADTNEDTFASATMGSLSPAATEFIPSSPTAIQSPNEQMTEPVVPAATATGAIEVAKSPQQVLDSAKAELIAKTGRLSMSVKEPGSPEAPAVVVAVSEDPAERENATHFASWGTPQARTAGRKLSSSIP